MTVINNKLRAKIEVGNYNQVEADITLPFEVGEIVIWVNSGAFAEVLVVANVGDNYISVGDITGSFSDGELFGTVSGLATANGTVLSNGVSSHQQRIPAIITSSFVVDEIISGLSSTAFAQVAVQANIGDTFIVIKQLTRQFDFEESLVGGISGLATSNGSMTTGSELYTNPLYGIDTGIWTLETTGNMIASIDDSVMKINIDQGGNLASGYQFGFSLANFGLVDAIEKDGLFLKHLPTRYYIDFGTGYVQVWAGIIDTFPKTGDTTAQFKCTDAGKANIEKIGSDTVPIALNRNYNCKLILSGPKDENFQYVELFDGRTSFIVDKDQDETGAYVYIPFSSDVKNLIDDEEFDNIIVEVVFGGGIGGLYNAVRAENVTVDLAIRHKIYLDTEDISELSIADKIVNIEATIIVLKKFNFTYNLSENPVQKIHTTTSSNTSLPIRIKDGDRADYISPSSYESDGNTKIIIKDVINEDSILLKSSIADLKYTQSVKADTNIGLATPFYVGGKIKLTSSYFQDSVQEVIDLQENNDAIYFRPKQIRIKNAIYSDEVGVNPLNYTTDDMILRGYKNNEYSKSYFGGRTIKSQESNTNFYFNGEGVAETMVTIGSLPNHYDVYISTEYWLSFKSRFEITKRVTDNESVDKLTNVIGIDLLRLEEVTGPSGYETYWSDEILNLDNYTTLYSYDAEKESSVDNIAIGCNGENVQSGNEFENYPDTIKYIQTEHIDIPLANINTASYSGAEDDYGLFDSVTARNPSHQITSQVDANSVLKDMLKSSHLGLYLNRLGQYSLENWLPKSKVFSDLAPTLANYTSANWVKDKGISVISRSQITPVVADFQLTHDLNEATGDKQQVMRIKRTDLEVFDFDLCTEGISVKYTATAQQAWELLRAGYLRAKKLTQTTLETNWIKMSFSDGTGESEAINFIRNQAGHVNRELEKVTIRLPLNATDAIIDLLSFVSVKDQKRTSNETRRGWIVDHKISWKSKEVIFKILLDISQFDPFLVQLNIIQDNATVTDIIQQDATATSIIQNGTGK